MRAREKVSIVVPTYNERDNIQPLVRGICRALADQWTYEVIFVDDKSPDGTADIVRQVMMEDPRIRLLERPGKLGLGTAVVDGLRRAQGDYWVMMDGDLSHRPEHLPCLLCALSEADIVIGSRYMAGGGSVDWPQSRIIISKFASGMARMLLGLNVQDVTSGYAAFRRELLSPLLPSLNPKGFKLLLEILAKSRSARTTETPIMFVDRLQGRSKFSGIEVLTFVRLCLTLRYV